MHGTRMDGSSSATLPNHILEIQKQSLPVGLSEQEQASSGQALASSGAECAHVSGARQGADVLRFVRHAPRLASQMKPSRRRHCRRIASAASASARVPAHRPARGLSECPCRPDFKPEVRQFGIWWGRQYSVGGRAGGRQREWEGFARPTSQPRITRR